MKQDKNNPINPTKNPLEPGLSDINKLLQANELLSDKNSKLEMQLETALQKINWFEEQFKLMRSRQFGKSSETATSLQVEMIFNADEGLKTPSEEETQTPEETETITYTRRKKNKNGRNIDTSTLPRLQEIHDLTPEQKICACGHALHKVRDEVSEKLEVIPRQVYVVEHIHPQYACSQCVTMTSAEKEPSPVPKSMAGASFIADVAVSKYEHHLPLYRQSKILDSQGIDIADNTLGNWLMQAGDGLLVMDEALQQEMIQARYLQVDETPVKVLEPEKKAYMWVFLSPLPERKLIRFQFDLSRSGSVAEEALKNFSGLLQNDGYGGYNGLREQPTIVPFGCMAHARRKFADVVKMGSKKSEGKAQEAITYFAKLYLIEEEARKNKLTVEQRKQLRQTQAIPILGSFHQWLLDTQKQVPPESAIGKALSYTIKQWPYLIRYADFGEVEIDTNWVENQIRPMALGKKNWLFVMHEGSARIAALYYSLIQSAKLNGLNPRVYLHYLLTQIHALRKKTVNPVDLLPHRIDRNRLVQFVEQENKKIQRLFVPANS